MTKCYYENGQKKSDHEKLLKKSDFTKEILEAKYNQILKMTTKLQDWKTAAKTYWTNSSNKKFQQYHLY